MKQCFIDTSLAVAVYDKQSFDKIQKNKSLFGALKLNSGLEEDMEREGIFDRPYVLRKFFYQKFVIKIY